MNVEFIGIPGAGKTTISKHLKPLLEQNDINATTVDEAYTECLFQNLPIPKLPLFTHIASEFDEKISSLTGLRYNSILAFQACYPEAHREITKYINLSQSISRRETTVRWLLSMEERQWLLSTSEASDVILWDEGLIHRMLAIFNPPNKSRPVADHEVRRCVESLPFPDMLVTVNVDTQIAMERMVNRKTGKPTHYQYLDDRDFREILNKMQHQLDMICKIATKKNTTVIRLDSENTSAMKAAKKVTTEINQMQNDSTQFQTRV